jgi:transposase-like protein
MGVTLLTHEFAPAPVKKKKKVIERCKKEKEPHQGTVTSQRHQRHVTQKCAFFETYKLHDNIDEKSPVTKTAGMATKECYSI